VRPINLIPPEDRRGDRAPLRAGSMSYVVVGAFAAILVAVLGLVLTQNSVTDRENEIAQLEVARDAAKQRAEALAPYAEFASLQVQREQTIASLAQSRFDWERVLRELALVIPADITLDSLEASTATDAGGSGDAASGVGSAPSLVMSGCGPNHDAVAAFVAALEDIDGVTRVGLESSVRAGVETEGGGGQSGGGEAAGAGAACGKTSTTFGVTAAFDGVAAEAAAAAAVAAAAAAVPAETNSAEEQVEESQDAANLVTGAVR
jgi:Tfp pilus assembly protein PilN